MIVLEFRTNACRRAGLVQLGCTITLGNLSEVAEATRRYVHAVSVRARARTAGNEHEIDGGGLSP